MGSEAAFRLPVIDFSKQDLKPGTQEWETVRTQVRKALEQYGGFEANFDQIPAHIREALFSAMEELFDLPLETKLRSVSRNHYTGYIAADPPFRSLESLGIDHANILDKVESAVKVLWPQGNPQFSEIIMSYANKLSELTQTVAKMIIESFGVEESYTNEQINSTKYILRLIKYFAPMTKEIKDQLQSHTDYNFVTILYQNEVEGLQMQKKNGDWVTFKPTSSDSFLIIIGDAFYAATNGRLHSPPHKVVMSGNNTRYSIGLFSTPKPGYVIKAPNELIDEDHPLLFKPYEYDKFIAFIFANLDALRTSKSPIEAYCGVSNGS